MAIISVPGIFKWIGNNKRNVAVFAASCAAVTSAFTGLRYVPNGHVGLIVNRLGTVSPLVFDDQQTVVLIPFWQRLVPVRISPVKKRFIKEFSTKDGKLVEARLLVSIESQIHWLPEIYIKFGKDFGRGFLEREATVDIAEVCSKYTSDELVSDGVASNKAVEEVLDRLSDAAAFHRVKIHRNHTTLIFTDAEADTDEY